jgi:hypothetical protein
MITASELAGFIAAHAIWCVSESDGLIPMVAFTTEDGKRNLQRLVLDDAAAAVEHGRQLLDTDPLTATANDGVLAYDGRIMLGKTKIDAILLEMRSYAFPSTRATIAVPYTPASTGRFRVHRPKLIEWHQCEDFDQTAALEAFFQGVDSHEQGAKVWNEALDESK